MMAEDMRKDSPSGERSRGLGMRDRVAAGSLALGVAAIALALGAGVAGAKSFEMSVMLVGLALACVLAACMLSVVAVVLARRDGTPPGRIAVASCIMSAVLLAAGIAFGVPHGPKAFDKNPYANTDQLQCVATFVVGQEFSMPGTVASDGYVIKVPEGTVVDTPQVLPKPGLTFVGWRYGGTGDPDVAAGASIVLDANGTKNNSVILYAEFVDGEGNAYCSCGATSDVLEGSQWQGEWLRRMLTGMAVGLVLAAVTVLLSYSKHRSARDGDGKDPASDESMGESDETEVAESTPMSDEAGDFRADSHDGSTSTSE